jgi:hypothetical protein
MRWFYIFHLEEFSHAPLQICNGVSSRFVIPFEFTLWEFFALLLEVPHGKHYVLYTMEVLSPHLIIHDD